MVYGKTLTSLSKGELKRTGLVEAVAAGVIDPEKYLAVLQKVPQLEQLGKANLTRLTNGCVDS